MSAKFTPGPWRVRSERWVVATRGEHEGEILIASTCWLTHCPEEQAANSRLAAEAPTLLAELRRVYDAFAGETFDWQPVRAAIARALGEQPAHAAADGVNPCGEGEQ